MQLLKWLGPKQSEIFIDPDALRQDRPDERLAVCKGSIAEPVAENRRSVGQLKYLGHGDTPLKRCP